MVQDSRNKTMKLGRKLIGTSIMVQTIFAIIFFSAVYFSYSAITEKLYKSSLLERYSDDALDIYIILHLAESGDEDGTKESLNLKLDTYVYEIHQLAAATNDQKEKTKVSTLLGKISRHRKSYPRGAKNVLQKEVDNILEIYQ